MTEVVYSISNSGHLNMMVDLVSREEDTIPTTMPIKHNILLLLEVYLLE